MYDPILDHITNLPGEDTAGASGKGGRMSNIWFGKGCEHLVAQWEGSEYTDGPDFEECEPVLKFCKHTDNKSDTEGNCLRVLCPLPSKHYW